jgi:hypothetical protein
MSAPCFRISAVAEVSRSPLSERGTDSGSIRHSLAQEPISGSDGMSAARPGRRFGTVAEAAAISVARMPACRAWASSRSGTAKKPHEPPTRARTPIPAVSDWVRSSMSPLRADIDSKRRCITLASA